MAADQKRRRIPSISQMLQRMQQKPKAAQPVKPVQPKPVQQPPRPQPQRTVQSLPDHVKQQAVKAAMPLTQRATGRPPLPRQQGTSQLNRRAVAPNEVRTFQGEVAARNSISPTTNKSFAKQPEPKVTKPPFQPALRATYTQPPPQHQQQQSRGR
ncbi:MAG: hypothetical protein R3C18_00100 [Planctomycetaceae bacterium]